MVLQSTIVPTIKGVELLNNLTIISIRYNKKKYYVRIMIDVKPQKSKPL